MTKIHICRTVHTYIQYVGMYVGTGVCDSTLRQFYDFVLQRQSCKNLQRN
jgi:hypothetical protein